MKRAPMALTILTAACGLAGVETEDRPGGQPAAEGAHDGGARASSSASGAPSSSSSGDASDAAPDAQRGDGCAWSLADDHCNSDTLHCAGTASAVPGTTDYTLTAGGTERSALWTKTALTHAQAYTVEALLRVLPDPSEHAGVGNGFGFAFVADENFPGATTAAGPTLGLCGMPVHGTAAFWRHRGVTAPLGAFEFGQTALPCAERPDEWNATAPIGTDPYFTAVDGAALRVIIEHAPGAEATARFKRVHADGELDVGTPVTFPVPDPVRFVGVSAETGWSDVHSSQQVAELRISCP